MKVFVLGGTGAAGRSSVRALLADDHDVTVQARSAESEEAVAALGARPWTAPLDDHDRLRDALAGHDAIVDLRVAIPAYGRMALPGSWRGGTEPTAPTASLDGGAGSGAGPDPGPLPAGERREVL